ncbi:MAG: aspartate aminotransferase [Bacillota bacterium]|nr:MAG: aspartate aminotransferase [Bacillota bacterium]MBS3950549.1 pyridoxal phosphate-dependent aminotransferase [Peptococcaceae bacterium]
MPKLAERALNITPSVTLSIDSKAKQMVAQGIKVVNFGVGEPDFNTPENICYAAIKAIHAGHTRYTPASGTQDLRQAICDKLKTDNGLEYTPAQIVVSNGAKHSIYNTLLALCDKGDEVIIPAPYWVSYPEMVKMTGATPVFVETREEEDFKVRIDELRAAVTPKTKALFLNSPSNPTGMVYSRAELQAIADLCVEFQINVISDEIYEKLLYDGAEHISIASLGAEIKDLTIVINGMSKAYAMTGWRIGYTASNKEVATAMASLQSHATSNPNSIAQFASVEALRGPQETITMMVAEFARRRLRMVELINNIPGLSCRMPKGAFYVMANVSQLFGKSIGGEVITDDLKLSSFLLEKAQVATVPGSGFGAGNFIRLSYATSMENIEEGLKRIADFLNS